MITTPPLSAGTAMRQATVFARSSPGQLVAIGMALILCCLAAGGVVAEQSHTRQQALRGLLNHSEPFLRSTEQLYSSLSTADAAAGTAFLYSGQEPRSVRNRYTEATADAATQLADSADADTSEPARTLRRGVAAQLPVYTGLVETARADNHNGLPVGAAYLGEASHLMQETMLPMAQDLHHRQAEIVAGVQRGNQNPPWLAIGLTAATLIGLAATQIHLSRRWRRRLNPGLLFATAALLILFIWVALAGTLSAIATHRALVQGTKPLSTLSDSRIAAQQARAAETLKLVRHDTSTTYDHAFDGAVARFRSLLDNYSSDAPAARQVSAAREALGQWLEAHRRMSDDIGKGDFDHAAIIAVGPGIDDAPVHFLGVDQALQEARALARAELRAGVADAAVDLDLLTRGAVTLTAIAVVAVGAGITLRLWEYR